MAYPIFAILYTKLDKLDSAYKYFTKFRKNLRPPFGVLAETSKANNPYFITGAGAILQSVLFGFAGLKITDEGLIQGQMKLPKAWKNIIIKGFGSINSIN